jgi:hypothetical protein
MASRVRSYVGITRTRTHTHTHHLPPTLLSVMSREDVFQSLHAIEKKLNNVEHILIEYAARDAPPPQAAAAALRLDARTLAQLKVLFFFNCLSVLICRHTRGNLSASCIRMTRRVTSSCGASLTTTWSMWAQGNTPMSVSPTIAMRCSPMCVVSRTFVEYAFSLSLISGVQVHQRPESQPQARATGLGGAVSSRGRLPIGQQAPPGGGGDTLQ